MPCFGDQPFFRASVNHDPCWFFHIKEVREDTIVIKVPVHTVESEGFIGEMTKMFFCYQKCKIDYFKLYENLKFRIPDY